MIDINVRGQEKLEALVAAIDEIEWTPWELEFIQDKRTWRYENMSDRVKSTVGRLYDKLARGF